MTFPNLIIDSKVVLTARMLENLSQGYEWYADLFGQHHENSLRITDILLQKQVVSKVAVNSWLNNATRASLRNESMYYHIKNGRTKGKRLVGLIHSHNSMGLFLSATDLEQVKLFVKEIGFTVSIVVGSKMKLPQSKRSRLIEFFTDRSKTETSSFRMKLWIDGPWQGGKFKNLELNPAAFVSKSDFTSKIPNEIKVTTEDDYKRFVKIVSMIV